MLRLAPMFPNYFEATRRRGAGRLLWSGVRTTRGCPCWWLCSGSGAHRWRAVSVGCQSANYNPFAFMLMRAARKELAQLACGIAARRTCSTASSAHRKKSWRSPLDRWRRAAETAWTFPESSRPRCRPPREGANQGDTSPITSRKHRPPWPSTTALRTTQQQLRRHA